MATNSTSIVSTIICEIYNCLGVCARRYLNVESCTNFDFLGSYLTEYVATATKREKLSSQIHPNTVEEVFSVAYVCMITTWGQCGTMFLAASFNCNPK